MYSFQPVFPFGNQPNVYAQPMYPNNYMKYPTERPLSAEEKPYISPEICVKEQIASPPPIERESMNDHSMPPFEQKHIITPEKNFQCNYCKKGFSNQFFLKNHELTHTGLKPFECSFCGKAFTQKNKPQEPLTDTHRRKTLPV